MHGVDGMTPEPMTKEAELRRSKMLALAFFAGAALLFVLTLFLPQNWWTGLLRAFSEAAMVGALADWFAVVALFKRVPIPIVARHTEIIPKNKERIADNLGRFVHEKFLDTESIVGLIQRHDPVQKVADWLVKPANTELLGRHLVRVGVWLLDFIEDSAVQGFIRRAVHAMVNSVDLSKSAGTILESLTRDGRHQELLNEGITQLARLLDNADTQATISQGIVDWLKEDYAFIESMLPSELIGRKGAGLAVRLASGILNKVASDPSHPLRARFDSFTQEFIERLKADPSFAGKADEIKAYLLGDETLNGYLATLWGELKGWVKQDLQREDSRLRRRLVATGAWVGKVLAEDPQLRASLSENLESAARGVAPEFAGFLTRHIADTVKQWDDREMSEQIELNIGKDLQYIRINGTIVGGLIGVTLYLLSQAHALF
ncbi:membrane protein [Massilia varians]|uniref:Membrane protein n=2 Tax=Massilia varians TaxID=457921 RepID=A0ABN6TLV1_9BURK|nr:membrane protein [Massilia varians]